MASRTYSIGMVSLVTNLLTLCTQMFLFSPLSDVQWFHSPLKKSHRTPVCSRAGSRRSGSANGGKELWTWRIATIDLLLFHSLRGRRLCFKVCKLLSQLNLLISVLLWRLLQELQTTIFPKRYFFNTKVCRRLISLSHHFCNSYLLSPALLLLKDLHSSLLWTIVDH